MLDDAGRANARFWSGYAQEYLAEHGSALGEIRLLWCPEGLTEDEAHLLGDVAGARVLEVGCGAAQGARWVAAHGGDVVATDIAPGMLAEARSLNRRTGVRVPLVEADARALPFADGAFDVAFTAYGAIPFVPDPERVFAEVSRVLRPGGRWVFSTCHPMRWVFADDPTVDGLRVVRRYFDAEPYTEGEEELEYAEFQHTVSDLVNGVLAAGMTVDQLLEPRWSPGNAHSWGAWSEERAPWVPGTVILRCHRTA